MDAEIGYITAFGRPKNGRFELYGSAVGERFELSFAMLMPQGDDPLFLTIRYTWLGLSALFIKNNYSSRLFIYDFIRTP